MKIHKKFLLLAILTFCLTPVFANNFQSYSHNFDKDVRLTARSEWWWSRFALSFINDGYKYIHYYYVDWNAYGLTDKQYYHTINPYSTTWDWTWANALASRCLEMEIPLNENTSLYMAITYKYSNSSIPEMDSYLYFKIGKNDTLYDFSQNQWEEFTIASHNYDGFNYHGKLYIQAIKINKISIFWLDQKITTFDY